MINDFHDPTRSNLRLEGYDYSKKGRYFITICCKNREHFFGEIENKKIIYSDIGKIAIENWASITDHFSNIILGEFVAMPNHIHGIIEITNDGNTKTGEITTDGNHFSSITTGSITTCRDAPKKTTIKQNKSHITPLTKFGPLKPGSISIIIGQYKAAVTRCCSDLNVDYFAWQRRFHDHIIRNNNEYYRIENYIKNNIANWKNDDFYK